MDSPWLAVAIESQQAARLLARSYPRSSVSRSYYAAYAVCSGWLERQGVSPGWTADGVPRDNYAHRPLPSLLRKQMMWDERRWSREIAKEVEQALSRLLKARTTADYVPDDDVSALVRAALRDAALLVHALAPELQRGLD